MKRDWHWVGCGVILTMLAGCLEPKDVETELEPQASKPAISAYGDVHLGGDMSTSTVIEETKDDGGETPVNAGSDPDNAPPNAFEHLGGGEPEHASGPQWSVVDEQSPEDESDDTLGNDAPESESEVESSEDGADDMLDEPENIEPHIEPEMELGYSCEPNCGNRMCGSDGCGGQCGQCQTGTDCNETGRCLPIPQNCTPRCHFGPCGPDGCGGSCGQCVDGTVCVDVRDPGLRMRRLCRGHIDDIGGQSDICPPSGNDLGTDVGDIVPDAALHECHTHEPINHWGMCENTVSVVYQINIDCSPCIAYVHQVLVPLHAEFAAQGLQIYVVFDKIEECDDIRRVSNSMADLTFLYEPVRFSLTHIFRSGGKGSTTVMDEGNRLLYYGKGPAGTGPTLEQLQDLVQGALTN